MEVLYQSIGRMAATGKIKTVPGIEKSFSKTNEALKKFSDFRALAEIILELFYFLVGCQGGAGVEAFVKQGGLKTLLEHLKKSQFSAKTQINGWKTISVVLSHNASYVEHLRSGGTLFCSK